MLRLSNCLKKSRLKIIKKGDGHTNKIGSAGIAKDILCERMVLKPANIK